MKIIQIIHAINPGGAERLVVDLCNQFSLKKDDEVFLIVLKNRDERNENFYISELYPQVRIIKMNYKDGFKLSYVTSLYLKIKKIKPDIVHIHCVLDYLLLTILFFRSCHYIYTIHNIATIDLPGKLRYIAKFLSKFKLIQIATISTSNRQSYRDYIGLTNDVIVYNGRSQPLKSVQFEETKSFISNLRTSADDIILLSIAKCSPQKNIELLINSVNTLSDEGHQVKLIVIGDGYQTSALGKKLISMNTGNIHFLGPQKNVADYFYLSDGYCISSIFEGMPITLIEALACKCTLVSTPVSGVVDILIDGKTGFISPDFTQKEYLNTLRRFISDKNKIDKLIVERLYQDNFSIAVCSNNYYQLYLQQL